MKTVEQLNQLFKGKSINIHLYAEFSDCPDEGQEKTDYIQYLKDENDCLEDWTDEDFEGMLEISKRQLLSMDPTTEELVEKRAVQVQSISCDGDSFAIVWFDGLDIDVTTYY